jgi:hypothetical protein
MSVYISAVHPAFFDLNQQKPHHKSGHSGYCFTSSYAMPPPNKFVNFQFFLHKNVNRVVQIL